jgi:hypothetical protein
MLTGPALAAFAVGSAKGGRPPSRARPATRDGASDVPSVSSKFYRASRCPTRQSDAGSELSRPSTCRGHAQWALLWNEETAKSGKAFAHLTKPFNWNHAGFHQSHQTPAKKQFQVCATRTTPAMDFTDVFGEANGQLAMANYGPRDETLKPTWGSSLRRKRMLSRNGRVELGGPFFKPQDSCGKSAATSTVA